MPLMVICGAFDFPSAERCVTSLIAFVCTAYLWGDVCRSSPLMLVAATASVIGAFLTIVRSGGALLLSAVCDVGFVCVLLQLKTSLENEDEGSRGVLVYCRHVWARLCVCLCYGVGCVLLLLSSAGTHRSVKRANSAILCVDAGGRCDLIAGHVRIDGGAQTGLSLRRVSARPHIHTHTHDIPFRAPGVRRCRGSWRPTGLAP